MTTLATTPPVHGQETQCPDDLMCSSFGTKGCYENQCVCQGQYAGLTCNECFNKNYYLSANQLCLPCDHCSATGSLGTCYFEADRSTVYCNCHEGYTGLWCDECASDYHFYNKSCVTGSELIRDSDSVHFSASAKEIVVASTLSFVCVLLVAVCLFYCVYRRFFQNRSGYARWKDDRVLLAETDDWNGHSLDDEDARWADDDVDDWALVAATGCPDSPAMPGSFDDGAGVIYRMTERVSVPVPDLTTRVEVGRPPNGLTHVPDKSETSYYYLTSPNEGDAV